ncbi:hypothetical protein MUU49_16330 [Scandinavium goeteborgense]|jgi:flagellar biosynthesis/type III secretory pathway M-ring protein FliF/YscJ|uniref:hypothetical protein n=1 Tax=Scandinavium goeteborgense TaxID=1851514 RepID=UPI000D7C4E3F|nr:hypothetical protein [Scandinavium goeteborgense]MCS2154125.1 hypothetical protein [Scandinavium goeteborgense]
MILGAVIVWAGLIVLILLWIAYDERRLKRQIRRTREEREQKEMAQFSLHQEWREFLAAENDELEQLRVEMHPLYASQMKQQLSQKTGFWLR